MLFHVFYVLGLHGGPQSQHSSGLTQGSFGPPIGAQRHLNPTGFYERHEGRGGSHGRRREHAAGKYEEFKEPDPGRQITHRIENSIMYCLVWC